MPVDPRLITLELQAINGALTLANNTIKRVQAQTPPGPPEQPVKDLLSTITATAVSIQQVANTLLQGGGDPIPPP